MALKTYWLRFGFQSPTQYTGLAPTFIYFINQIGATLAPPGISEIFAGTGLYRFTYNLGDSSQIVFVADGATTGMPDAERYVSGSLDSDMQDDAYIAALGSTLLSINTAVGSTLAGLGSTVMGIGSTQTAIGTNITSLGTTQIAIGNTLVAIGSSQLSIGTTLIAIGNTLATLGASLTVSSATIDLINQKLGTTASSFGGTNVDPGDIFGYVKRLLEFNEGNQNFNKTAGSWDIYSRGSSTLLVTKALTSSSLGVTRI